MENQIGQTTLQQLGGGRFKMMTGASKFVALENGLQFSIPKSKGINKVVVTLNGSDLYDVDFWNIKMGKSFSMTQISKITDVYNDNLQDIFTQETGLYTHL